MEAIRKEVLDKLTAANALLDEGKIEMAEALLTEADQLFEASNNTRHAPQASKLEILHHRIQKAKRNKKAPL